MPRRIIPIDAVSVNRPSVAALPVVVSVPHAGRVYPAEIMATARVAQRELERLEDRWCDLIAMPAVATGATVVHANWARAVADCNRSEGQMAPGEVVPAIRPQFAAPGRKERAGLGVVPTRLADAGPLWKKPIDQRTLQGRLDSLHRPYHRALGDAIAATRTRFGCAVLIDFHSMPPIPVGQLGHGARIVVGDYFGATADDWLTDQVMASAAALDVMVSRNQPYSGGHIIRSHGKPEQSVHAVQIEIDRTLYLHRDGAADDKQIGRLGLWFNRLVESVCRAIPGAGTLPQAAE